MFRTGACRTVDGPRARTFGTGPGDDGSPGTFLRLLVGTCGCEMGEAPVTGTVQSRRGRGTVHPARPTLPGVGSGAVTRTRVYVCMCTGSSHRSVSPVTYVSFVRVT